MRRYRAISVDLSERDPGNHIYIMEVAYSATNLAGMELTLGRPARALRHIDESATQWRALINLDASRRDYHQGLAEAFSWQGSILQDLGHLSQAITSFEQSQATFEYLRRSYDHKDDVMGLGAVAIHLANSARLLGELDYALSQYESVRKDMQSLSKEDTQNALWKETYAKAMIGLGETYRDLGDHKSSHKWLEAGFEIHQQLVSQDSTSKRFQAHYALAGALLAENAMSREDAAGAKSHAARIQTALTPTQSFDASDERLTVQYIQVLNILGRFEKDFGQVTEAPPAWQDAVSLLESLELNSLLLKALYVRLMHKIGRGKEVVPLHMEIKQSGLKAPDFLP
jgi:tetratricopeptide (TPR) repeat protein